MSDHKYHFTAKCGAVYRTVVLAEHYDALAQRCRELELGVERLKAERADTVKVPRELADLIAYALHGSGWFVLNRKLRALLAGGEA